MRVTLGIYTALIVQLIDISFTSAVPSHLSSRHITLNYSALSHDNALMESRSNSVALGPSIIKRDWRHILNLLHVVLALGVGWYLQYDTLDLISPPVTPAFAELIQFYSDILYVGRDDWANEPARLYWEAAIGSLKLVFHSNHLIAWEWIDSVLVEALCRDNWFPFCIAVFSDKVDRLPSYVMRREEDMQQEASSSDSPTQ